MEQWDIPYEEGTHTEKKILSADRIVKSPGIPDKAPMVQAAVKKGIPIISEIVSPQKAHEIYRMLAEEKNPPMGIVFDWTTLA